MKLTSYKRIALFVLTTSIFLCLTFVLPAGPSEQTILGGGFQRNNYATNLKNWKIYGPSGGSIKFKDKKKPKEGIVLSTEKTVSKNGKELWTGGIIWKNKAINVIPGLKYQFTMEARSDGLFKIALLEYGGKFSPKVISRKVKEFAPEKPEWKYYSLEYTPSSDKVCFVRPLLELKGWRKRLEIRGYSLSQLKSDGTISISAKDFITSPGKSVELTVKSSSYPVKLLVFGPDGTCGDGGETGGSGAWTDHFKSSHEISRETFKYHVKQNAIEGAYRIVAVNPKGNVSAEMGFNVYSRETAEKILSLTKEIDLPENSRIIFIGDSLTDLFRGRNYVSLIKRALKWKYGNDIDVVNAGVGGDNVNRIIKRLKRDVINKKPTLIFIFEGANDIKKRYDPTTSQLMDWAVPADKYEKTYRDIVSELKKSTGAKIAIATCAPADQNIRKIFHDHAKTFGYGMYFYGLPEATEKVVKIQKKIAEDNNLDVVETNKILTEYMKKAWNEKKQYMHVDDGVHLSEFGNRETALIFLEYLAKIKKK